jgi:hypothetical protein
MRLGMIGGVKPNGGYYQDLDDNGRAHSPTYKDYSQLFRHWTHVETEGYVKVGDRDGKPVYAAPDYLRDINGNYLMVSAADAARLADKLKGIMPTRAEIKALYARAHAIPMATQPIWKTGGPGSSEQYTRAIDKTLDNLPHGAPVKHGKEFFRADT